jgi:Family of unknown function (DUF5662)
MIEQRFLDTPPMSYGELCSSVGAHARRVRGHLQEAMEQLAQRGANHDASKVFQPEADTFCKWRPIMNAMASANLDMNDPQWAEVRKEMGAGLERHYANNRHHPEHFANGIEDMGIFDLIEMVCDWKASALEKGVEIDWEYISKRYKPDPLTLRRLKDLSEQI